MKDKLLICDFIRSHSNWEEILSKSPYCITVSRDRIFCRNLMLLKYRMGESDFSNEMVRECRGLILDEDTLEPICVPFFKFGNYGEGYCPSIDWSNCWVSEKIDGSLIKIVKSGNDLLISTNGMVDAFKCHVTNIFGCGEDSFGKLVVSAIESNPLLGDDKSKRMVFFKGLLNENTTYMFELTSPYNRVVVRWNDTRLNFLGARDNKTLKEIHFSENILKDYFNVPKVFKIGNIGDCIKAAEKLDENNEGFVVCDKDFSRIKVKSSLYVRLHQMAGNGSLTAARAIDIVQRGEVSEVISYFPEFRDSLLLAKSSYENFCDGLSRKWEELKSMNFSSRKDSAKWILANFSVPHFAFAMLDGKAKDSREWLKTFPSWKIAEMVLKKNG